MDWSFFKTESWFQTYQTELCISCEDIDALSVKILNKCKKSSNLNVVYRQSDGNLDPCKNYLQDILTKTEWKVISSGWF